MIRIRRLLPMDLTALEQILRKADLPLNKAIGLLPDFMVCESDGVIVGIACLKAEAEKGYLNWVYVDEESRRRKLGSALVKALLNSAELEGVRTVYTAGDCSAFLASVRFEPLTSPSPAVSDAFAVIFGQETSLLFSVSLVDYFKSCC